MSLYKDLNFSIFILCIMYVTVWHRIWFKIHMFSFFDLTQCMRMWRRGKTSLYFVSSCLWFFFCIKHIIKHTRAISYVWHVLSLLVCKKILFIDIRMFLIHMNNYACYLLIINWYSIPKIPHGKYLKWCALCSICFSDRKYRWNDGYIYYFFFIKICSEEYSQVWEFLISQRNIFIEILYVHHYWQLNYDYWIQQSDRPIQILRKINGMGI